MRAYLSASTIYRDAASYLAEWIEFHRLMGVERFFLYDNGSTDGHRDVLAPYESGHPVATVADAVRRLPWPGPRPAACVRRLPEMHATTRVDRLSRHRQLLFSPGGDHCAALPAYGVSGV
jgi:hypothetical protein